MDLATIWFILIGVLLTGYAILDGFDLGVGVLSLFGRDDREQRLYLNAIGPVWDGNEVWLLTGGGALFAAFPAVYATVFSGFYLACVLLLAALIARAVALEFRGKVEAAGWRRLWDRLFGFGSLVAALLLGVAFGNILRGVPIDEKGRFTGSFLGLLNPYALLVGVLTVLLFTMHGALYMSMKSEGEFHERMRKWSVTSWAIFLAVYVFTTIATMYVSPFLFKGLLTVSMFWVDAVVLIVCVIAIPLLAGLDRCLWAFFASSLTIACMMGFSGLSLYPRLVPSRPNLGGSLDIHNASSSPLTLKVMLMMALLGMPLVIGYTVFIYRVFRGKVVITDVSY